MAHKLGICIPYRNRKEHLDRIIPHLSEHLKKQGIYHKFYIAHQVDDKLFNRGAMKNIAAKHAIEDGCDYVAWHDVDMLTFDESDYSYPEETPIHIATKLSKYNYGMNYDQYFGGVVLFNKEHLEKTNGYSNDYWDWGMEDDDLFWRCYYEGYTTGKVKNSYKNKTYAEFNGTTSKIEIPCTRELVSLLHNEHTISLLFYAEQQQEKVPIWMIGDQERRFIEYPLFRKTGGYNYSLSFNNSRAVTMCLFNEHRQTIYNWLKRFENMWTWVTLTYNKDENKVFFYLNDEFGVNMNGVMEASYFPSFGKLLRYDSINPFFLGHDSNSNTFFKGKISEIKIYNKFFNHNEINNVFETTKDGLVLHYDFEKFYNNTILDNVDSHIATPTDIVFNKEDIDVVENIIPYRRDGKFFCLPHIDEGYVGGKWAKGETTAKNEKRFVTEMQQKKINYKNEGISTLKYELINIEECGENSIMINVKL
jgi:hypothetical protein